MIDLPADAAEARVALRRVVEQWQNKEINRFYLDGELVMLCAFLEPAEVMAAVDEKIRLSLGKTLGEPPDSPDEIMISRESDEPLRMPYFRGIRRLHRYLHGTTAEGDDD